MEHFFSYHKQLRKEITVLAKMKKKWMLQADVDEKTMKK